MALEDTTSQTAKQRRAIRLRLDHLSDFVRVRPPHAPADSTARAPQSRPTADEEPAASPSAADMDRVARDAVARDASTTTGHSVAPAPPDAGARNDALDDTSGMERAAHEAAPGTTEARAGRAASATDRPAPVAPASPESGAPLRPDPAGPETSGPGLSRPESAGSGGDRPPLPPWPHAAFWTHDSAGPHVAGHSVMGGAREVAIANQTERAVALRVADFGAAVEDLASMLGGIEGENPLLAESLRGVVRDAPDVDVRTWLHALLHLGRVAAPALRDALFAGQRRAARARADQLIRAAPTITGCARIAAVLALGTADTTTPGTPAEAAPLFFEALATSAFAHCLERLRDDLGVIEHWLAEDTQAVAPIHLEGASSWAWALAPRPTDGHSRTGMVPWTPTPNAHGGVPAVTHLPLSPATRAPVMRTPVAPAPSIVGLPTLDDAEREPPTRWETTTGAAVARPADRRRRSAFGVAHRLLPEAVAARSDIRRLWLLSTAFSLLLLALALTVQILGPLLTADTRASDAGQGAGVASIQATQTVAVVPTTSLSDTTGTTAATPAPTTARPTTAATTAKPAPPSTGAAIVPLVGTLSLHCGVNTTLGLYNATTSVKTFTLAVPPGVRSNGLRGVVNPGKTLPILLWLAPRTQASRATATLTAAGHSSPIVLTIPSC